MCEGVRRESRRELSNQTFVRSKSNSAVQNLTIDNHGIVLSIHHVFAFRAKAAARPSRNSSDAFRKRSDPMEPAFLIIGLVFLIIGFVLGYSLRAAISHFRRTRAGRITH